MLSIAAIQRQALEKEAGRTEYNPRQSGKKGAEVGSAKRIQKGQTQIPGSESLRFLRGCDF